MYDTTLEQTFSAGDYACRPPGMVHGPWTSARGLRDARGALCASFADLPAQIEALAAEREQLAVVLLDAFGWAFVQRHADHPLLQRLEIEPIALAVPVDHHRAPDDALQRPAGRGARALRVALLRAAGGRRDPPAAVRARPRGDAAAAHHAARAAAVAERLRAPADDRLPAGGDRRHAVRLGGARGRAAIVPFATIEDGVRELARDAGAELPLLGPDRRRRAPATARRRSSSSTSRCARWTRWRRSRRRCS